MCPSDDTTPNATAPQRRDGDRGEKGLTTLEWLLVVAAIAGLAALAVVLVQNVVNETAETIESRDARLTAADIATTEIHQDWQNDRPFAETWDEGLLAPVGVIMSRGCRGLRSCVGW